MVEAGTEVEIKSSDEIKQVADVLAALVANPEEVTEEAQVTQMFMKTIKVWTSDKEIVIPTVTLTVTIGLVILKSLRK